MKESDNTEQMEKVVDSLEEITVTVDVELPPDVVVKYVSLKQSPIPIQQIEETFRHRVKQSIEQQYDNKDEIITQMVQQGQLGEAALDEVEGIDNPDSDGGEEED